MTRLNGSSAINVVRGLLLAALAACQQQSPRADTTAIKGDTTKIKARLTGAELDSALVGRAAARNVPSDARQFLVATKLFGRALVSPLADDEQKFIVSSGSSTSYGPHVWAFGADSLDSYDDFTNTHLVAALYVSSDATPSGVGYSQLGLTTAGNYCVFLKYTDVGPKAGWHFETLNAQSSGLPKPNVCQSTSAPADPTRDVVTEQSAFWQASSHDTWDRTQDYPPSARLLEGKNGQMFLAVPCGNQLCILGTKKHSDVLDPEHGQGKKSVTRGVRLWHDDQALADLDGQNQTVPSKVRAALIPDQRLGSYSVEAMSQGPVAVAAIEFKQGATVPQRYRDGYGLESGYPDTVLITLTDLHNGTAMIRGSGGRILKSNLHVTREDDSDIMPVGRTIPAVARWKWSDNDEQIWVRCDVGCCMIDPDISSKAARGKPKPSGH